MVEASKHEQERKDKPVEPLEPLDAGELPLELEACWGKTLR